MDLAAEYAISRKEKHISLKTVGEAIDDYIASKDSILSPSTIREYKRIRKNYFQNLMAIKIKDLNSKIIQQAINDEMKREDKLSPKTIKNAHGLLTASLGMAAPDLSFKTTLPARIPKAVYKPTSEDVERLIQAVYGTDMEIPVLLAATCTLRRGEVGSPYIVNQNDCTITIHSSMVKTFENTWVVNSSAKTYAGNRTIVIPRLVMDRIVAHMGASLPLVPGTPDTITRRFAKILKKYDIPQFRFHDLRHYSASVMSMLNIPDKDAMERGGWTTNAVMKQVYQHAMDESRRSANEKINTYFDEKIANATRNATYI